MGKLSGKEIIFALGVQIFWAVTLLLLMKKLYMKALIKLQVAGG